MRRREEITHVWVRTDAVEAALQNGGESLPPGWKPSRKRGRSESNKSAKAWGWARAHVVQSASQDSPLKQPEKKSQSTTNYSSPFGHVKLRKVGSPASSSAISIRNSPEQCSSVSDHIPLTITLDDSEFAPSHRQNVTVTLPRVVDDERIVYMANTWWHAPATLQDVDTAPDDLTTLTHLHEPAVVYCLKHRYERDLIYTYTGKILLALNPFRDCKHLYGPQVMKQYCMEQEEVQRPPPHIYAIAQDAYGAMMRALQMRRTDINTNQSILVSGESGAGKTVTTKIIMRYLATLSRSQVGNADIGIREDDFSIESQVLQSNPILESFGNARTVRNDNSSRFGKFIEIQFYASGCLACASIETYLLEKVRLITQAAGERNYHIFYELLAGASMKEKRVLQIARCTPRDFRMTSGSSTYDRRDGVSDRTTYQDLIKALDTVGFSRKEQMELFTIACALLHASNLTFTETDSDASALDKSNRSLQSVLLLMGVGFGDLNNALCTCAIEARGETLVKNMSLPQAKKALEALIKATYGAMFDHIVRRVNSSITVRRQEGSTEGNSSSAYIGVLDIFGFESFDVNSFEQLCINYCNEALQQQFNKFVFKLEQQEYEEEGIEWSFITFPDNQEVLDVIEKKHTGILSVLDEQCRLPRSTDSSFARATYEICSGNPRFQASNTQQVSCVFSVHHYAGLVEYDCTNFLEKNKDELANETTDLLLSSSHPLLPTLGKILREPPAGTAKQSQGTGEGRIRKHFQRMSSSIMRESVGSQFSRQLRELRNRIEKTTPHYVRCLKPNDELVPNSFRPLIIADQLRCAGVLEAIRVSRVGFPQRFAHEAFVQRYRILAMDDLGGTPRQRYHCETDLCKAVVNTVAMHVSGVIDEDNGGESRRVESVNVGIQMGLTKVFLRRRAFDSLELARSRKINAAATKIQSAARMFLAREWYEICFVAVLVLQSFGRRLSAIKQVRNLRHMRSAVLMQCAWRRYDARRTLSASLSIAKWTQNRYRGAVARAIYTVLLINHKACLIQRYWRKHVSFRRFMQMKFLTLALQRLARAKLAQLELKRLRQRAKDIDVVTAERDKFREESAKLRRELASAKSSTGSTKPPNENEEIYRLRKEIERLENSLLPPPTTALIIPSDGSEQVDELQSLASECVQKDRELQLLREEVASLRAKSLENVQREEAAVGQGCGPYPSAFSASDALDTDTKCQSPPEKKLSSDQMLSPFKSLFGTVCRGSSTQNKELVGGATSPSRKHMLRSARSIVSTSLLDDVDDTIDARADQSIISDEVNEIEESVSKGEPVLEPVASNSGELAIMKELLLHRAASDGDIELLRERFRTSPESDVEINEGDFNGRTPLHLAVLASNLEISRLLLENGAVANSQDYDGCTPLHLASDLSISELLLVQGNANPNIPNLDGVCVLHLAVRRRDLEFTEQILSYKPNVNVADDINWYTPLHLVAQPEDSVFTDGFSPTVSVDDGCKSIRTRIADCICDVAEPSPPDLNYQDSEGNTPMHHAAMLATPDACDLFSRFLQMGGDPNIANRRGQTVLHLLCHNNSLRTLGVIHEILHLVLFYGADPNRQTLGGCTALHLSLYNRDIDSAIQLANGGAELHLVWKKPKNWTWVWDDIGSSEVLALDMVEDGHSLHRILASITKAQKWAPSRPNCMHCRKSFGTFTRALHCRHCGSLVCGACSHRCLGADMFPKSFGIEEPSWVCTVCETILTSRKEENDGSGSDTQPNSSVSEGEQVSFSTDYEGAAQLIKD